MMMMNPLSIMMHYEWKLCCIDVNNRQLFSSRESKLNSFKCLKPAPNLTMKPKLLGKNGNR